MTTRTREETRVPSNEPRNESGAVLALALVFLIIVGGVITSLATWATNDLGNSSQFSSVRSLQYAADSATELAIQDIRYTPLLATTQTLNASPPSYCWGNVSSPPSAPSIDGDTFTSWCSTAWNPSNQTRVVTISTCLVSGTETNVSCAAAPYLQAVITFVDHSTGSAPCVTYCGVGMTVDSWAWSPVVPSANFASGSLTSGSIDGGTTVTLAGTGFVSGSTTVNFVEESGGTPSVNNVIVPATNVNVTSSTSLTASSPAVTQGTTYFVTVTTPGGTSPYVTSSGASPIFTYAVAAPTVTGFDSQSLTTGSTSGGTPVTIDGTGFVTGATVNFVQESGGTVVSGGQNLPGSYVTVLSSNSLTVVSPAITSGSTYFVDVTTPGESSVTGPVFTYSLLIPVVAGFGSGSATSGPTTGNTSVTISGFGFYSGTTVNLTEDSGGTGGTLTVSGANVTVSSSTSITFTTPTAPSGNPGTPAGTTYTISVTTSAGTSSGGPIFTYT